MHWINCYLTLLARRILRSFFFFLCLIITGLTPHLTQGQSNNSSPNTDSINYYLRVAAQGEKQVGIAFAKIGFLYLDAGRYNSALNYFDQALPLLNGENKSMEVAEVYQAKGTIYQIFGDNAQPTRYYRLAENQYTKSLDIYGEIRDASGQLNSYKNLANISAKRRNFASAVIYQNKVIDELTKLYHDSLQLQADSFNDLLNQEIESSKDTILIEKPGTAGNGPTALPLWDWRHWLLLIFGLLMLIFLWNWLASRKKASESETALLTDQAGKLQMQIKIEELQKINLALSRTEKEQRNSNLAKDKVFSIISHDLRSPINTISGFLNILGVKLKSVGDIELKALAKEMEDSTGRLSQFLDDLLKWSMSQMGKIQVKPERIEMTELVEQNYLLVESRLKSKNIHFKTNIDQEVVLYTDVSMINLVLRNLISNAIKFTRQGGYIAIGLNAKGPDQAELTVSDDGIGIGEEELHSLFEFNTSAANGVPGNKGAGIGLMLCKEFVELNGGEISVQSTIGKGSRFTISLPRKPAY